jgi:hypothetical protein
VERELGRFQTKTESGDVYAVVEMQEFVVRRTVNGAWIRIDGLKRLELEDGSLVNCIDPKTYQIVSTGEMLRKV